MWLVVRGRESKEAVPPPPPNHASQARHDWLLFFSLVTVPVRRLSSGTTLSFFSERWGRSSGGVLVAGRFATSREDGCLTTKAHRTKEVVLRSSLARLCSTLAATVRQCRPSVAHGSAQLTCLSPLSVLVYLCADVFIGFRS